MFAEDFQGIQFDFDLVENRERKGNANSLNRLRTEVVILNIFVCFEMALD